MKVRHKISGMEIVVDANAGDEYYLVSKKQFEPIPTDQWGDVTEACKWTDHLYEETVGKRMMGDIGPISILCSWENGYRLVKEQYMKVPDPAGQPVTYEVTASCPRVWAFRVERKTP